MPCIIIRNRGGRSQEFQVHGFNNNQNVTVNAGTEVSIDAPDGQSGAVIAVYDGQVAEQAEITKCGWNGNDVVDISNICGGGGNMTVQQVGDDPRQYKGHETFMQACNNAWHGADQDTRNQIQSHVFLDDNGNVKRIGAPKENQALERFVRTFAQGRTYIGVGAWGDSAGDAGDNAQSSAGVGSKDILITYSDGDASPEGGNFGAQSVEEPSSGGFSIASAPEEQSYAPGIVLTNRGSNEHTYYFYDNYWNGNGTAGANFDNPLKNVTLAPGASTHVPLDLQFKGRVQKGTELPATWVEFQIRADDDQAAHGDISLQQGCDCAAEIASTDGSNVSNGFSNEILQGAPEAAIRRKPNGEVALDTTVGNWNGGPNQATIDYLTNTLGQGKVYILGGTGVPDVASKNNCLAVTFY
ncbi:hypothetical protein BKA67DRAFT_542050 [Truncatella angustata]|uniref:Uncharacterized protein n=1 Tax=Truncatella angustata TaxID=152316 RepID=A0A9P8UBK9_9PEZI|nr:uncharacterized protein BKA67DRAFT_542050 [Truncatella angustata]KAH6645065.1 hypothetical protein BKA67DRAFT_542050 [Truncatella angustata]KAH8198430.1 hypothetical protein TruAng_007414 [Truncatella angustata]